MATGLRERAIVYTEAANGVYTIVDNANLRCAIKHVRGGASIAARAELASIRRFLWDANYFLPEDCEILIDGQRWNPVANTFGKFNGPNGNPDYRACDVVEVRADSQ